MLHKLLIVLLVGGSSFARLASVEAADRPASRVLFIGIDGCRRDALGAAKAPNLRSLIDAGAFSDDTNIVGTRTDTADTVSGPGWSNLLTGVWADKHGVLDNKFKSPHYEEFPHFFRHVKEAFPRAYTCSYCTWEPIQKLILSAADDSKFFPSSQEVSYVASDEQCAAKAVQTLNEGDPDVMFVYLGNVDETGHKKGFHPSVPEYIEALQTVDGQIGRILDALRKRPRYREEKWLLLVSTDHGGRGTNHSGGRSQDEVNTVFLIVSGDGAAQGTIPGRTNQVDVVATALTHLGVMLKPEWQLDGRAVGLANTAEAK
jgi:predicted AlkP superfamily pyrophosphatase or phosphodiesterase